MSEPTWKPKVGTVVHYKNVGYGLTCYEEGNAVTGYDPAGRMLTETFDNDGFEWKDGRWVFDGGLGLRTYAVPHDDPDALKAIAEDA